jgi:hypothetical protein
MSKSKSRVLRGFKRKEISVREAVASRHGSGYRQTGERRIIQTDGESPAANECTRTMIPGLPQ